MVSILLHTVGVDETYILLPKPAVQVRAINFQAGINAKDSVDGGAGVDELEL